MQMKMGIILELVFYIFFTSRIILIAEGSVYSSGSTALKFSHCMIEKLLVCPFFNEDDCENITKAADDMAKKIPSSSEEIATSVKISVTEFITTLADIVVQEDQNKNMLRKMAYAHILGQCAVSSTGNIDSLFIKEALDRISILENIKASNTHEGLISFTSEEYFNPTNIDLNSEEPDDADDTIPVQPSPVQTEDKKTVSYFGDETIYESPRIGAEFSVVPVTLQSKADSHLPPMQTESGIYLISKSENAEIEEKGSNTRTIDSPFISQTKNTPGGSLPQDSSELGGLLIPQMKESEVYVIPPADISPSSINLSFQDQPFPESIVIPLLPSTDVNIPSGQESSISLTSSATLPQKDIQVSEAEFSPLDNIIYVILINSPSFTDAFNSGINKQYAISLARTITQQSLSDHSDIIDDAMNAVSSAVAAVPFSSPENYARAISDALGSVIKFRELSFFVDGARITTDMLSHLENTNHDSLQLKNNTEEKNNATTVEDIRHHQEREQRTLSPGAFFLSHPLPSKGSKSKTFYDSLCQNFEKSDVVKNYFCNPDLQVDRLQTSFSIIKSCLSEYGEEISSAAAKVATDIIEETSDDKLCANYAHILAEVIVVTLSGGGFLGNANPEDIANRITVNIGQKTEPNVQSQEEISGESEDETMRNITNPPEKSMPTLQPSFSSISDKLDQGPQGTPFPSYQPPVDYSTSATKIANDTTISDDASDIIMQNEKYLEEIESKPFEGFDDFAESKYSSPLFEPFADYAEEKDSNVLTTTPFSAEITDEKLSDAETLIELVNKLSESFSTQNPLNKAYDYTTENNEELESLFQDEVESVLEDLSSIFADQTSTINYDYGAPEEDSDYDASAIKNLEDHDSDEYIPYSTEHEVDENVECSTETVTSLNSNEPTTVNINEATSEHTEAEHTTNAHKNRRKMATEPQIDITATPTNENLHNKNDEGFVEESSSATYFQSTTYSHAQPTNGFQIQDKELHPDDFSSKDFPHKTTSEEADDDDALSHHHPHHPIVKSRNSRRQFAAMYNSQDDKLSDSRIARQFPFRIPSADSEYYPTEPSHNTHRRKFRRFPVHQTQEKQVSSDYTSISPSKEFIQHSQISESEQMHSENYDSDCVDSDYEDSSFSLAKNVSEIASSSMAYIKSENFNFSELCERLKELTSFVNVPPLDSCEGLPLIEFLLHVLGSVTKISKDV